MGLAGGFEHRVAFRWAGSSASRFPLTFPQLQRVLRTLVPPVQRRGFSVQDRKVLDSNDCSSRLYQSGQVGVS